MRRATVMATAMAALLLGPGCAFENPLAARSKGAAETDRTTVLRIMADADANGRRPVAVDVVRVADQELAQRLATLDAAGWFRTRTALRAESGSRIAIVSWEVVPGQTIALHSLPPFAAPTAATFAYALYAASGLHRQRLAGDVAPTLRLGRDGFTVEPPSGGSLP